MKPSQLTVAQARFLRALEMECDVDEPPLRLLGNVRPWVLARWLGHTAFRERLRQLKTVLVQRRELALTVAAARAAERLGAGNENAQPLDADQRRVCVELVKLAREAGSAGSTKTRRRRTAKTQQKQPIPGEGAAPPATAHPEISADEAGQLLRRLGM